jgi:predicted ABC-type ATPase
MKIQKQLWVLAGGNGAGKSTFYRLFLEPRGIKLISADVIAKAINPENQEAATREAMIVAERLREDLVLQGISFCFETVFSHPSKIDFVAKAKSLGYKIILVYIQLDTPELNAARVHQRVSEGGHTVPDKKIRSRIPRTMKNIATALPLIDEARLLDNSLFNSPFRQVAVIKQGSCTELMKPLPDWAITMLKDYIS